MTNLINMNNNPTMSSLEIAELTGKTPSHIHRDIRNMLEELEIDDPKVDHVLDSRGYVSHYNLDKELTLTLVSGYSIKLRNSIIKRWKDLEDAVDKIASSKSHEQAVNIATDMINHRKYICNEGKSLTQSVLDNKETIKLKEGFEYSTILSLVCKTVLNVQPKKVVNITGLSPRDFLATLDTPDGLIRYEVVLAQTKIMVEIGMEYQDIKASLKKANPEPFLDLNKKV